MKINAAEALKLAVADALQDPFRFIPELVYIEDKDSLEGKTLFNMWDGQKDALQTFIDNRLTICLKARQLGLTTLALAYSLYMMLKQPGYTVVGLSRRDDDAKELIRRMVFNLRYLPMWIVEPRRDVKVARITWESTTHEVIIYHPDGQEPSRLVAMPAAQDSGRSFTANLVLIDEWAFQQWAEEIWSAAYPTINRPTGGKVIGLSTAKRGTLFETIWEGAIKGENGFKGIFLPWTTDPRRTPEWYEQTKNALPTTYLTEYPSTPEDAFSGGEGVAFPEFTRDIHVCKPFTIPYWWKKWRSNDPGYTDPFVWYCYAASEDGKVYVYREYTREPGTPRVPYSEQAKELTKRCVTLDEEGKEVPEKFSFTVCGRDAFNRHPETGKSIVDYYHEGGVKGCIEPPRDTKTDRVLRAAVIHECLKPYLDENTERTTAKLQIFSTCTKLIETLPKLMVEENDPEKVAECSIDHCFDSLGYGLIAWHAKRSTAPAPEKSEIQRDKEQLAKRRGKRNIRKLT